MASHYILYTVNGDQNYTEVNEIFFIFIDHANFLSEMKIIVHSRRKFLLLNTDWRLRLPILMHSKRKNFHTNVMQSVFSSVSS